MPSAWSSRPAPWRKPTSRARDFPLANLLDLPGAADEEADLEGMAVADGFLWVVGSHGLKRKNAKPDRDHAENAKRLAKVALDGNRRLLACLPIERDASGVPCLVRQAEDGRWLLLGLRGPLLSGWSALLEIAIEACTDGLRLVPLDDNGMLIRKHFLQLDGLGAPDLHFSGDDLYILAGPTMVLNGDIRVFKWPAGGPLLAARRVGPCCTTRRAPIARRASPPASVTCCATIEIVRRGLA